MKEHALLAEIEYSQKLMVPTAFEAGIWRYCFYATGEILPFMEDTFNRVPVKVNNIIIDHIEYTPYDSLEELRGLKEEKNGWVNGGSVVYVRFPHYRPPYVFYSHRYGILMGFTSGSPMLLDGTMYRPGLLSAPAVEQSADAFTYDRMKFISANISIDNTSGPFDDFDNVENLFGNEFNLLYGPSAEDEETQPENAVRLIELSPRERLVSSGNTGADELVVLAGSRTQPPPSAYTHIAQYYIANIVTSLNKADFHLKDKRERLSAKIPGDTFDTVRFPKIDDNLIEKDMQEAYGRCYGVPGVCLNGKQIYVNDDYEKGDYLKEYQFRFAREIKEIDRIQVKMTSGKIGNQEVDGWTTVYQREKPNDESVDDWPDDPEKGGMPYPRWKPGLEAEEEDDEIEKKEPPGNLKSLEDEGIITLRWDIAKQGGKHENKVNEVRMDGIFINKTTPLEIIKDIMENYSGVPDDSLRYYTENEIKEIDKELAPLTHEIGILFDKPVSVYEAVERLQSGCALGFQFQVYQNKYTARLDNPNRPKRPDIRAAEILNLNEAEVDWNADLYGTYTDIEYAHDYGENSGRRFIDKDRQSDILDLHRIDKDWSVKTLLSGEDSGKEGARLRSGMLLEDFVKLRPLIRNIRLAGEKWFDLRVYDIMYIDFSIAGEEKYPRNIVRLIEYAAKERSVPVQSETDEYVLLSGDIDERAGDRDFAGKLRCQVLRVELDTQTGITSIDVRVREKSKILKESNLWAV